MVVSVSLRDVRGAMPGVMYSMVRMSPCTVICLTLPFFMSVTTWERSTSDGCCGLEKTLKIKAAIATMIRRYTSPFLNNPEPTSFPPKHQCQLEEPIQALVKLAPTFIECVQKAIL